MSGLQKRAAKLTEWGLYAMLLIQPLTGLVQSLTRGHSFQLLIWTVPPLVTRNKQLTGVHRLRSGTPPNDCLRC